MIIETSRANALLDKLAFGKVHHWNGSDCSVCESPPTYHCLTAVVPFPWTCAAGDTDYLSILTAERWIQGAVSTSGTWRIDITR